MLARYLLVFGGLALRLAGPVWGQTPGQAPSPPPQPANQVAPANRCKLVLRRNSPELPDFLCDSQAANGSLSLLQCQARQPRPAEFLPDCPSLLLKHQACQVHMELLGRLAPLAAIFGPEPRNYSCGGDGRLHYSFAIRSIDGYQPQSELALLENITALIIDWVQLQDSQFQHSDQLRNLLNDNFANAQQLTLSRVRVLGPISSSLFESSRLSGLERLVVEECAFQSVGERGFLLGPRLSSLRLDRVTVGPGTIDSGALRIQKSPCAPNSALSVHISDTLTNSTRQDPLLISHSCSDPLALSLTLENGALDGKLPQSLFGSLLTKLLNDSNVRLSLRTQPIECCHPHSDWLFQQLLLRAKGAQQQQQQLDVVCSETGSQAASYQSLAELQDACQTHNVFPVLVVAAIVVLALALVLAALSILCIFWILPNRKRQRSHQRGPSSRVSEANSSAVLELRSTQTDTSGLAAKMPLMALPPDYKTVTKSSQLHSPRRHAHKQAHSPAKRAHAKAAAKLAGSKLQLSPTDRSGHQRPPEPAKQHNKPAPGAETTPRSPLRPMSPKSPPARPQDHTPMAPKAAEFGG